METRGNVVTRWIAGRNDLPAGNPEGGAGHAAAAGLRTRALHYGIALMVSVLALQPVLVDGQRGVPPSLLLFLGAVVVSTRYGGLLPGLLSASLGALVNFAFSVVSLSALEAGLLVVCVQAVGFVVVALSIILAIEQRRQAQARYQDYVDFVGTLSQDPGQGVCVLDQEGRVTFLNATAERMLGWREAELHDVDARAALQGSHPPGRLETRDRRCPVHTVLRPSTATEPGLGELVTREGHTLQVEYSSSPLIRAGKGRGTVFTFRDVTEPERTLASLKEREERYRILVEASPDSLLLTDLYGYITLVNQRTATLYGYARAEDLLGSRIVDLVAPEDRLRQLEDGRNAAASGTTHRAEYRGIRPDGSTFPVEIRVAAIRDKEAGAAALLHVCTDLTERQRTEAILQVSEVCAAVQHAAVMALAQAVTVGDAATTLLQAMGKSAGWSAGMLWMLDASDGVLRCHTLWSEPATDLRGLEEVSRHRSLACGDDLPGRAWASGAATWVPDIVADARSPRALMAAQAGLHADVCVPVFAGGSLRAVIELFSRTVQEPNGDLMQTMATIGAQFGQFLERKEAEKALAYQARHDALTNLPNRALLQERMERALATARSQNSPLALLLLDLDRFKEVNDTLGHHYGDLLLRQVSARLMSVLRDSDTVARLGGDEFAVILPAADVAAAGQVADKILRAIEQPYSLEGQQVDVGVSIGIAAYPVHGGDAYTLMQCADVAMYAAKRVHGGHAVYTPAQDENSPDRLSLMAELRHAIANQRLFLHYQPKVNLKTGLIESVEALARWDHPIRGMVPPEQFIPLAEQSGLTKQLGYFVLDEALRQCQSWQQASLNLGVAVNLSARNIRDPRLVEVVAELLRKHGLPTSLLTLEITESAIMVDSSQALEALTQLHHMGVRIAIDDFGTGYSSLAYLKRLPVHEIKIDRSFITDMVQQQDDAFIARTVIDLGHRLGLGVVAEGVQSPEVRTLLEGMDCDHVQGFHLSHPLSAAELTAHLMASRPALETLKRATGANAPPRTQPLGA